MKTLFFIISCFIILSSCNTNKVADKKDYQQFLQSSFHQDKVKKNDEELLFWNNKLATDTGSYVYLYQLAQHKMIRFSLLGNPDELVQADSLLMVCNKKISGKEPSIYYALIQNAITQHQFKKAENLLIDVTKIGGDPYIINLLEFDVNMELGKYSEASFALQKMGKKKENFDYLLRSSKLLDHRGEAKESMEQMEKAYKVAQKNKNEKQLLWSLTNLADKYGHEGNIKKAYQYYIKSLEIDSANLYSLKGIAKICFANDNNSDGAKEILQFVQQNGVHPDNYLLLAEMAETQGNENEKSQCIDAFNNLLKNKNYGVMYNKYTIEQYLETEGLKEKALLLSKNEIYNRATPETYSWLAFAYYKNNDPKKAQSILEEYVMNKTYEPNTLFLMSIILEKTNRELSLEYIQQSEQSKFELGPTKYKILQDLKAKKI